MILAIILAAIVYAARPIPSAALTLTLTEGNAEDRDSWKTGSIVRSS